MGVTGSTGRRGKERGEGMHEIDEVQTIDSMKMDERKKSPVLCYISREGKGTGCKEVEEKGKNGGTRKNGERMRYTNNRPG